VVIEYDAVTVMPNESKWIRGVVNLLGCVEPVVNLGVKFGMGERPVTKTSSMVIVEGCVDSSAPIFAARGAGV
jgi:purine-binding chemotaxis protein CheW